MKCPTCGSQMTEYVVPTEGVKTILHSCDNCGARETRSASPALEAPPTQEPPTTNEPEVVAPGMGYIPDAQVAELLHQQPKPAPAPPTIKQQREARDHFCNELDKLVHRFEIEYEIDYGDVIAALEIKKAMMVRQLLATWEAQGT